MVAVAYKRLTGKTLLFWKSGRLREVVAQGGSTVIKAKNTKGTLYSWHEIFVRGLCGNLVGILCFKFRNGDVLVGNNCLRRRTSRAQSFETVANIQRN